MIPSHGLHEMKAVTELHLFQGLLLGLLGLPKYHYGEIGKADSHAERQNVREKLSCYGAIIFWGPNAISNHYGI